MKILQTIFFLLMIAGAILNAYVSHTLVELQLSNIIIILCAIVGNKLL